MSRLAQPPDALAMSTAGRSRLAPQRPPRGAAVQARRRPARRLTPLWPLAFAALLACGPAWAAPAAEDPATPAAASPSRAAPPLMQANAYRAGIALAGYWVSEKYDGVRAYWDGQRLVTRQGEAIRPPAWFTQGWPDQPLDGELWAGRGGFEIASAAARRREPVDGEWRRLRFMAFDLPAHGGPFDQRLAALRRLAAPARSTLAVAGQRKVESHAELRRLMDAIVRGGGEGLMLHRGSSLYSAVRSDDLLKLKPHDDAEATVIGHVPGKGKYQGLVGALRVRTADGREFRIGSGLTDALRRHPPAIGTLITYRYRGLHASGLPRFATYWRVRSDR